MSKWPSASNELVTWKPDQQTSLTVIVDDVVAGLSSWQGLANAWFLDGFSPAKNPDMWSVDVAKQVFEHTAAEGTFSTYTSAGWVRRNFEASGVDVTRSSGFGRKRHMLTGRKP